MMDILQVLIYLVCSYRINIYYISQCKIEQCCVCLISCVTLIGTNKLSYLKDQNSFSYTIPHFNRLIYCIYKISPDSLYVSYTTYRSNSVLSTYIQSPSIRIMCAKFSRDILKDQRLGCAATDRGMNGRVDRHDQMDYYGDVDSEYTYVIYPP